MKSQWGGVGVLGGGLFSMEVDLHWRWIWIPAALFFSIAGLMLAFAFLPGIEIRDTHLAIGKRMIPWEDIRRLDRTGFISPLVMIVTLENKRRLLLVYPGGLEASNMLMRH